MKLLMFRFECTHIIHILIQLDLRWCHVTPTHPVAPHSIASALPYVTQLIVWGPWCWSMASAYPTEIHPMDNNSSSHDAGFKSTGVKLPLVWPVVSMLLTNDNYRTDRYYPNIAMKKFTRENLQMCNSTVKHWQVANIHSVAMQLSHQWVNSQDKEHHPQFQLPLMVTIAGKTELTTKSIFITCDEESLPLHPRVIYIQLCSLSSLSN